MPLSSERRRGVVSGASPRKPASGLSSSTTRIPTTPATMRKSPTTKRTTASAPVGRSPTSTKKSSIGSATGKTSASSNATTRPKSASPLKKKTTAVIKKKAVTLEKAASPAEESTEEAPHDETPCRESMSHAEEEEEADVYVDLERLSVAEAAVARSPAPSLNLRADSSSDAAAPSSPSSPHGESVVATLAQLNRSLDRAGEVRRGLEVRCDATEAAFRAAIDERDAVRLELEDVAALNATLRARLDEVDLDLGVMKRARDVAVADASEASRRCDEARTFVSDRTGEMSRLIDVAASERDDAKAEARAATALALQLRTRCETLEKEKARLETRSEDEENRSSIAAVNERAAEEARARANDARDVAVERAEHLASRLDDAQAQCAVLQSKRTQDADAIAALKKMNEQHELARAEHESKLNAALQDADAAASLLAANAEMTEMLERNLTRERETAGEIGRLLSESRAEAGTLRERLRSGEDKVRDADAALRRLEADGPLNAQLADTRRECVDLRTQLDAERARRTVAMGRSEELMDQLRGVRDECADEMRARKEMEADVTAWSAAVHGREAQIVELRSALEEVRVTREEERVRAAELHREFASLEAQIRALRAQNDALIADRAAHRGASLTQDSVTSLPGFGNYLRGVESAPPSPVGGESSLNYEEHRARLDSGRTTPADQSPMKGEVFGSPPRWKGGFDRGAGVRSPLGFGGSPRAAPRTGWER